MKRFLIILFSIACLQTNAQNLVTPITINLPTNPPANIADWATAMPPIMILAQTKMQNGYINADVIESKILVTIKISGGKVCGSYTQQTAPLSNFTTITKNWTGAAAIALLGQICVLQPGSYEFCVQFYSMGGGAVPERVLGEACKSFIIKDGGKETFSPPVNVSPAKEKVLSSKEANAPLTFRWTPIVPRPKESVTYKLRVWQIEEGQIGTQAIKANTPILEKEVKNITQSIDKITFPPCAFTSSCAIKFTWNVEASKKNAMGEVEMLGVSEATAFGITNNLSSSAPNCCPAQVVNNVWVKKSNGTQIETFDFINNVYKNVIISPEYDNCNEDLYLGSAMFCLDTCNKQEIYTLTNTATNAVITGINSFKIPATLANGKYSLKIDLKCGDKICKTGTFGFEKKCIKKDTIISPPSCCPTQVANNVWVKKSNGIQIETFDFINNVYKNVIISPEYDNCNEDLYLGSAMFCLDTCNKQEIYTLTNTATNAVITGVNSFKIPATLANGKYSLKIDLKCGDKICKTGTFGFEKNCIPENDCCKNATQMPPKIVSSNGSSQGILDCVNAMPFRIDQQNKNCKIPLIIKAASFCNANKPSCKGKVVFTLNNSLGISIQNATNIITIPTSLPDGDYNLVIDYYCGQKVCTTYNKRIVKECKVQVDCCLNSNWEDMLEVFTGTKGEEDLANPLPKCDSKLGVFNCKTTKEFQVCFTCAPSCGKAQIVYDIVQTGKIISTKTVNSCDKVSLNFPTIPGNYKLIISAKCNDKTCKTCTYDFSIECDAIPTDCCKNAAFKDPSIYDATGTNLFKLSCATPKTYYINAASKNCDKELTIKASSNCGNTPNCSSKIVYKLTNTISAVVITQTGSLTIPAILSNGSYKLSVDYYCGNSICKTCTFDIIKECAPPTNCCLQANWGEKHIKIGGAKYNLLSCGTNLAQNPQLKTVCGETIQLECDVFGGNTLCGAAKAYYAIVNNSNVTLASTTAASGVFGSITLPNISGNYNLVTAIIIGNDTCKKCVNPFSLVCTQNNCCQNSKWETEPTLTTISGFVIQKLDLANPTPIDISINKCTVDMVVKGNYLCNSTIPNCSSKVVYTLVNNATATITNGTNSIAIPTSLANGSYTLTIAAYCGNSICKSYKFQLNKDCQQNTKCCQGSSWGDKMMITDKGNISLPVTESNLGIFKCGDNKKFKVCFNCAKGCGTAEMKYEIYKVGNMFFESTTQFASYSIADITLPTVAGYYGINISAICNGEVCQSLGYYFTIDCPVKDCCKDGKWVSKTINWPGIKNYKDDSQISQGAAKSNKAAQKSLPIKDVIAGPIKLPPTSVNIECGKTYHLNQTGSYTFNADYSGADKTCTKKIMVKIEGVTDHSFDGTYPAPLTKTFNIAGDYKITYLAYLGGQLCGTCEFVLTIDKVCCTGSKWIKAQYQIVNKKADGAWDFSDTKFYDLSLSGGVPTIKADVALNIYSLDYACMDQVGCKAEYIIKRKNLTTGVSEPDELLTAGKNDASVYAKPYPQIILIQPLCGGQSCGNAIMFKLECLNKDCIVLCNTSKYELNISTGQDENGVQIANNILDPLWGTGTTSPGLTDVYIDWNKISGASILIPGSINMTTASFTRCFYVCKPTKVNFNGIFRVDNQVTSFELINSATSSVVWNLTGTSFPLNNPQCYNDNPFSGSVLLQKGKYCFVFSFKNEENSDIGFSLNGTITSDLKCLSNTGQGCCFTKTDKGNTSATSGPVGNLSGLHVVEAPCNQNWMQKNLDVEYYRNGDVIPQVTDQTAWSNLTTGAWCYYNNDPALGAIYGKLYNWYAVNDPRGLAPQGWHIPSNVEWTTLSNCLGGVAIAGGKMKEGGETNWDSPNIGADNSSGFTGLPGGIRILNGNFVNLRVNGFFWCNNNPNSKSLSFNYSILGSGQIGITCGCSVRCVKD